MSIYTKTGDKGKTSLFEAHPEKRNRISKSSLRIEAIGAVDEANSYLGIANIHCRDNETKAFIKKIQKILFQIGATLSQAPDQISEHEIVELETKIDEIEEMLPPLRNFLMPDGSESAVHFMYARSLVRRAERSVVALSQKEDITETILKYLNRLSDYLFMVFRVENHRSHQDEEIWMGKKS